MIAFAKEFITSVAVIQYSFCSFWAISPARPKTYAPTDAQSKVFLFLAKSPHITPDNTSPLPPLASPQQPVVFNTTLSPSVIIEAELFSNNTTLYCFANPFASSISLVKISSLLIPVNLENSPICGVITTLQLADFRISIPYFARVFNPSASIKRLPL